MALAVGACSTTSDNDSPPSPSPSASSSSASTDPSAAEREAVEAAYAAYWDAYVADAADVGSDFAAVEAATYYPLRSELVGWLADLHADGQVYTGNPEWTIEDIAVDIEASPASATIEACIDISKWTIVEAESGDAVEVPEQSQRYPATATAEQVDGTWYIADDTAHREESC